MSRQATKRPTTCRNEDGTLPSAQELGAEHLVGLESYETADATCWRAPRGEPTSRLSDGTPLYNPKVAGYYSDGTVYFERSDTNTWTIELAARVTPAMMTTLPAAEQERIAAHARWHTGHTAVL